MQRHTGTFTRLVAVVGDPSANSLAGVGDDEIGELLELAVRHRVPGSLAMAIRNADRTLPVELEAVVEQSTLGHLHAVRALNAIAGAFRAAGIRWAAVKGPAVARHWHRSTVVRSYHDLDLLVDPGCLVAAVDELEALGFRHRNSNWAGFRRLGVGELPLDDGVVVVDLHWHLLALQDHRRSLWLDTTALLDRAGETRIGGIDVPTLDAVDEVVHLCTHAGLAGAQTLAQLMDVHLSASQVERSAFSDRLRAAGASRLAGVVIDRSERLFGVIGGSSLAEDVVDDRAWLRLNRAVDRVWPLVRRGWWTPFPGSIVKAGRSTRRSTSWALAAQLTASARSRLGLRTVVAPDGPLDWERAGGGHEELGRYLAEVESGGYGG